MKEGYVIDKKGLLRASSVLELIKDDFRADPDSETLEKAASTLREIAEIVEPPRAPLSKVIMRHLHGVERRGREYIARCPFHAEIRPSFTIDDEKGFYHCFGCGAHGDGAGFLMRILEMPHGDARKKYHEEMAAIVSEEAFYKESQVDELEEIAF